MKDLLLFLIQIVGYVCGLGFIGWILNRFFGFSVGTKGVVIPTEWEAGISFLVATVVCLGIAYFFGRKKKGGAE